MTRKDGAPAVLQLAVRPQAWRALAHLADSAQAQPSAEIAEAIGATQASAQVLMLQLFRAGLLARETSGDTHVGRRAFLYRIRPEVKTWLIQTRQATAAMRRSA